MRHFNKNEIVEGCGFLGPENLEATCKEMELHVTGLFGEGRGFRWGRVPKDHADLIGSCGFYDWKKTRVRAASIRYDLDPE